MGRRVGTGDRGRRKMLPSRKRGLVDLGFFMWLPRTVTAKLVPVPGGFGAWAVEGSVLQLYGNGSSGEQCVERAPLSPRWGWRVP